MTCRHSPGDTSCSSHPYNVAMRQQEYEDEKLKKEMDAKNKMEKELYSSTPDSEKYEIVDVARIGNHLVMKVLYPNCTKCSYEGNKVLVLLNVSEAEALRWRKIDPHFREPGTNSSRESPSPSARFPASKEGWDDAMSFALSKK